MTNNLKFVSKNFPARVETYDGGVLTGSEIVLHTDSNDRQWYATTTREIRIIDLPMDHPDVLAEQERRAAAEAPKAETDEA